MKAFPALLALILCSCVGQLIAAPPMTDEEISAAVRRVAAETQASRRAAALDRAGAGTEEVRLMFGIPAGGIVTFEVAAEWTAALYPDAVREGSALWKAMAAYHNKHAEPGSVGDLHPLKPLLIAERVARGLGIKPEPGVSIPVLSPIIIEASCWASLMRHLGTDRKAELLGYRDRIPQALVDAGWWPLQAYILALQDSSAKPLPAHVPRPGSGNPASPEAMLAQGVRPEIVRILYPKFFPTQPEPDSVTTINSGPGRNEIRISGSFATDSNGKTYHIRKLPRDGDFEIEGLMEVRGNSGFGANGQNYIKRVDSRGRISLEPWGVPVRP